MKRKRISPIELIAAVVFCVVIGSLVLPQLYNLRKEVVFGEEISAVQTLTLDIARYYTEHRELPKNLAKLTTVHLDSTARANEWIYAVKDTPCLQLNILRDSFGESNGSVVFKSLSPSPRSLCAQLLETAPIRSALSGTYRCSSVFGASDELTDAPAEQSATIDEAAAALGFDTSDCNADNAKSQHLLRPILINFFHPETSPISAISF